ncbi:hypothetical protein F5Y18DRAFT_342547 [Xylariaceae sp. FL1019]|nr:hypothetical protein F5Y18DRAFT_342547 [Xylariaceae sp. FL1019]
MFQTLKARRGVTGEPAYVVQSSALPFEKDKSKKQRACKLCKLKKLKCVVEGNSCAKCLKQGVECSYRTASESTSAPTPSRRTARPKSRGTPPRSDQVEATKITPARNQAASFDYVTPDSTPALSVQDGSVDSIDSNHCLSASIPQMFPEDFPSTDFLDRNDIQFDFWSVNDNTDAYFATDYDANHHQPPDMRSFSQMLETAPSHGYLLDPDIIASGLGEEGLAVTLPSPQSASGTGVHSADVEPTESSPSQQGYQSIRSDKEVGAIIPSRCHCLEHLMSANEKMQVKLVWRAGSPNGIGVSVDDMLECQKDVLATCGTLLECQSCSLRSQYVLLVVSMCREMANGIEHLSSLILSDRGSQHGSRKRSCSTVDATGMKGLKPGGWRLDDEDEMEVIKSLIGIRLTRLRSLVLRLEKGIRQNHSDYGWIASALRDTVTEKMAALGSEIDDL